MKIYLEWPVSFPRIGVELNPSEHLKCTLSAPHSPFSAYPVTSSSKSLYNFSSEVNITQSLLSQENDTRNFLSMKMLDRH